MVTSICYDGECVFVIEQMFGQREYRAVRNNVSTETWNKYVTDLGEFYHDLVNTNTIRLWHPSNLDKALSYLEKY